jgi:hypothetical protein
VNTESGCHGVESVAVLHFANIIDEKVIVRNAEETRYVSIIELNLHVSNAGGFHFANIIELKRSVKNVGA